ncbi:MAG TPA: response regulator [Blastocatellia bacterium]|nr:response regulator [Blastocatellia bacterium]
MSLQGKRILVIEDELLLALCVGEALEEQGCEVIGPATSVRQGLNLVETTAVNGAILDINLNGELVYPVAKALMDRNIPFLFTTGYSSLDVPSSFRSVPRLDKPVEPGLFIQVLEKIVYPETGMGTPMLN